MVRLFIPFLVLMISEFTWAMADCRNDIERAVCIVDPDVYVDVRLPFEEQETQLRHSCIEAPGLKREITTELVRVMQVFPTPLKVAMCRTSHFFIDAQLGSTGMFIRSRVMHPDRPPTFRASLRLRRDLFDHRIPLHDWATWKEQLSFQGSQNDLVRFLSLPSVSELPQIETDFDESQAIGSLFFILAHELGHVFDQANHVINLVGCEADFFATCRPGFRSFGAYSWETLGYPKADQDFPYRQDFCFYFCDEHEKIDTGHIATIYAGLARSQIPTPYAGADIEEDWAEMVALWALHEAGYSYDIIADAVRIDVTQPFNELVPSDRVRYLREFFSNFEFAYP